MSTGNRKWPAQPERSGDGRRQTTRSIANITEDVRKYAAEQGLAEEEALKAGLPEKSKEFAEAGGEVYAKA